MAAIQLVKGLNLLCELWQRLLHRLEILKLFSILALLSSDLPVLCNYRARFGVLDIGFHHADVDYRVPANNRSVPGFPLHQRF